MKLRKILSVSIAALIVCIFTSSQIVYGIAYVDDLRQKRAPESITDTVASQFAAKMNALIRTDLTVPEGQAKGFFTNDYHSYTIAALFANPVEQIPDAVVNAVRKKLNQYIAEGKILSAEINDYGASEIDIQVTHRFGELNAAVQRLMMEAMKEGALKAQEIGLLKKDIDVASMSLEDLAKSIRLKREQ